MKFKKPNFQIPSRLFDAVYNLQLWQKALILLISWLVPLGLFWFLFLSGSLTEIDTISAQIPKLRQEIRILEAKKKRLPEMEKELRALKDILKQALRLLPEKEDIPSVLTEISSLGNEAGLEMKSFTPGNEKVEGFYAAIPVSLSFAGPFHNTLVFLDKVGKMARIVHIREVEMGQAEESANIWSRKAEGASQGSADTAQASAAGAEASGEAVTDESGPVERGSSWIINTKCTAVTYRFLTPEEQKALREAQSKKKKKKKKH